MTKKRKRKSQLMIPEANLTMEQMRYEFAKKLGYIDLSCPDEQWWDCLTSLQQSEVNGQVTKLLIAKAQHDMMHGKFKI